MNNTLIEQIDLLQKEVERLRSALREIADAHTWNGMCPYHVDMARQALEDTNHENLPYRRN